jgi:hypothetical protein
LGTRGWSLASGYSPQRYEALGELRQFLPSDRAFAFRGTQMRAAKQGAEVVITAPVLDEHRQHDAVSHGQLAADDRLHSGDFGVGGEARHSVEAIAIAQRNGRKIERGGGFDQFAWRRGAAEKTERAAGVEFDIAHWWKAVG